LIDVNILVSNKTLGKPNKSYSDLKAKYLNRIRWAVSLFYFSTGLCFSSWASRIPDIKTALNLSNGQLGTILFAIPVGQLTMMYFSGKLVTRFGSHKILLFSILMYAFSLTNIGLATNGLQLGFALYALGIFANLSNISVNTQGVYTERLFNRTIMTTFHGIWSLAGFTGSIVGLAMTGLGIVPYIHFVVIATIILLLFAFNFKFLIKVRNNSISEEKKRFIKYDKNLVLLGIIGFCSLASEGVMFDWSGVYFKDIVKVPDSLVVLGYSSFMIMMASGRFLGGGLITKFGRIKVMQVSGFLISLGLFIAVVFPFLLSCTIAFMMVGLGVSTIIPTLYSLAGKHPTVPTGEALTAVSSISFLGFLMGPPVIGYIAELLGLRFSFAFIGIFGFIIASLVSKIKVVE
jgi:MFS family permease